VAGYAAWSPRAFGGVTSNPTIIAKAISGSADYDRQLAALAAQGLDAETSYWSLVTDDLRGAVAVLRPVYDRSGGRDGFVSVELAPALAHDTEASVAAARALHQRIDAPNLLVKIPATVEGVAAVRQATSEGLSINVTLLFGLDRYEQIIEAYLQGLEADEEYGTLAATITHDVEDARTTLERLAAVGVDLDEVAGVLEAEGVAAFADSYDRLRALLQARAHGVSAA
jgi:transaldolase